MSVPASLVSVDWLQGHIGDRDLRLYDATVHLRPTDQGPYRLVSGREDYCQAHLRGAAFLDLVEAFSDTSSPLNFTLPSSRDLSRSIGDIGIGPDDTVVLYSSSHPMWATRAWWLLASIGHPNVAVLDGGLATWRAAGGVIEGGEKHYPATRFEGTLDTSWWADRDEVLAAIGDGAVCTLNVLPAAAHTGDASNIYGRHGHIAGSDNVPFGRVLDDSLCFRESAAILSAHQDARADSERTICYCGGGVGATVNAFALRLAGEDSVAIYDGSLSEWAADASLPMSR
jgi:thiosulfate/3-mercaptopyruvate sulfurtransferase